MSDGAQSVPRPKRSKSSRTPMLIALVVVAPVALSYAFYYLSPPGAFSNYGELLPTQPMPPLAGTRTDGAAFRLEDLRGRWVIMFAAAGACDEACGRMLYATRQVRTMQGKAMDRVERVWLLTDGATPTTAATAAHPGVVVVRAPPPAIAALPRGADAIHLVDPLGNQVLAWPRDPDIKAVARDLARLLKASSIG